jgi:hypothetical protein
MAETLDLAPDAARIPLDADIRLGPTGKINGPMTIAATGQMWPMFMVIAGARMRVCSSFQYAHLGKQESMGKRPFAQSIIATRSPSVARLQVRPEE